MNGSPEKLFFFHVRKFIFLLIETRMMFMKSMDDNTLKVSKCSNTKRERETEKVRQRARRPG